MGNFYEDFRKYKREIIFGLTALLLFISIKYVIVYVLPFIFAGIFVFLIHKPVNRIHEKTKIGRGFLAGMLMSLFLLIFSIVIWYVSRLSVTGLRTLFVNLPYYEGQVTRMVKGCCNAVENNLGINSITIETMILERVNIFIDELKVDVVPKFLGQTMVYGKWIFNGIMFVLVTLIAVILLAKDYRKILDKSENIRIFHICKEMFQKMMHLLGMYLKAQLEIILVVSLICFAGFAISDYPYPYIWGIVTGLLDVLPFVGTGVVLLPLALLQLLMGNGMTALILALTFVISALARELLEPKLLGDKMGVIPIAVLIAVYVGAKVFGVAGVIWGPLYMLLLYEIYKKIYVET